MVLPIILQVLLVIHVLKTGQERFWIFLLIFLPMVGVLAYFFMVLLPYLRHSDEVAATGRALKKALDPGAELRSLEAAYEESDTFENTKKLADAYKALGREEEAHSLYTSCLQGLYSEDEEVLCSLGQIALGRKDQEEAAQWASRLAQAHPRTIRLPSLIFLLEAAVSNKDFQEFESLVPRLMARTHTPESFYKTGKGYQAFGEDQKARDFWEKTLKLLKTSRLEKGEKYYVDKAREELDIL